MAAGGFEPPTNTVAIMDFYKINEPGKLFPAHLSLKTKQTLSACSYFAETITTVYRSVFTWLERYLGFLTTIGAYRREHLTMGAIAVSVITIAVSIPLCFPSLTAFGTTFRLVCIASGLE